MKLASLFSPSLPRNLVYMMQVSGYRTGEYLAWFWRAPDLSQVMYRKSLDPTPKARLLLGATWLSVVIQLCLIVLTWVDAERIWARLGVVGWLLLQPIITAHFLPIFVWLGQLLVQKPKQGKRLVEAETAFVDHPAIKVAVAGSYGKTTMKNMLATVIAEGKRTGVTPGNLNTPLGLAEFAKQLSGDEEVLIFELGESHPGDIRQLAELVKPNFGLITGVNEAHLSTLGSLEAATDTIFELVDFLGPAFVVGNGESAPVKKRADKKMKLYNSRGVNGWKVSSVKTDIHGTRFSVKKGKKTIKVDTSLLGKHQIGPLCAVVDLADALGLKPKQIEAGIAKIEAIEHRFKPYEMNGATIIDDTYNGNPDGIKAGIEFASTLKGFKRKVFVTPGLVDTAEQKAKLHRSIGRQAAKVFDEVVLMKNSNAPFIARGLQKAGFKGQLTEVDDPLGFYQNLESFVAAGDFVLLQNDLPDNYA